MRKVIIIYGMPGSGKGTQANLLASKFGMIHFDTGKYIEQVVHDPTNKKNRIIQREKKNFDAGILCTPSWTLKIVKEKANRLADAGFGIIFSGSPRTIFETFGDKKNEGLIMALEKKLSKKNIIILFLKISAETSTKRNVARRICSVCGTVVIYHLHKNPLCPVCMSKLKKRTLDKPSIIRVRHKEYLERTSPILDGLKKRKYKINAIDGEMKPVKVFSKILSKISK